MKNVALVAAALVAAQTLAAAAAEVNVYSYRQPELVAPLFDAFTAKTGTEVNVVFLKTGLVERLKAEGARSPADLVMTTDVSRLTELESAGVTQAVSSALLDATIPAQYRDPDGHWFGLTTRARIAFVSQEAVAEGDVTTYEGLADPKWEGRICTRSGTHSYNLGLIAGMIATHGEDDARAWLEGVKNNLARKPQGNDRAQVKAIWAGECDISLGNTYYMGKMMDDPEQVPWADAVRIAFPVFEGGGTHVNLSGMAMTAAAPHRDAALSLMEFLASEEAQEIYAQTNDEYPIAKDAQMSARVAAWGDLVPDATPLEEIARLRARALQLVEEVDFDG